MTDTPSRTTASPDVHLDPFRHQGDYGVDGSFAHVAAPVQAIGVAAFALAMTGVAVSSIAQGRHRRGAVAAALGGLVIGERVTSRCGPAQERHAQVAAKLL